MTYPICIFVITAVVTLYWLIAGVAGHESSLACSRAAALNKSFAKGIAGVQAAVLLGALAALALSDASALYVAWSYVGLTCFTIGLVNAIQLRW